MTTIGLLQPGEMGSAIGAQLVQAGHQVHWVSAGRGAQTRARAEAAGLIDSGTLAALTGEVEVILSVCPPAVAHETAQAVLASGFRGLYVDANAIAPTTAQHIADLVTAAGAEYVDGGIIGGPPTKPGQARLYLSGPAAQRVADLFAGSFLVARLVGPNLTSASALKLAYASWTKGTTAMLLTARAYAEATGVGAALDAEWQESIPALLAQHTGAVATADAKGWRWSDEMLEISNAFVEVGLPGGFHQAAAEVYAARPRPS